MARLFEWFLRRRFLVLLLAIGVLLVAGPILRPAFEGRLLFDALVMVVFLAAMLVLFREGRRRLMALLLGGFLVVGLWTGYVLPGIPRLPVVCAFHVMATLFLGFTVVTVLREIHGDEKVSADSVYGAFCGYLLIGLIFGHLYCLTESLAPGSFSGPEGFARELQQEDRQHFLLLYFGFITLTSVGFGDITPASDAARALAVLEALIGQFFIAILVAELIGKRVSQVIAEQQNPAKDQNPAS
jgi:voltage-gated potassium channel